MIPYSPTPVIELPAPGIRLLVKREDQNHPYVSGNKWWKLKYNIAAASKAGQPTLVTFGGAYSNHLVATAAAANATGLPAVGMVRGEEVLPLNPALSFARAQGMALHYVPREQYRHKSDPAFLAGLQKKFDPCYLLPEGGTNALAVQGCAEWGARLQAEFQPDYVCLPVGTGGTIAGICNGVAATTRVVGIPVLKGAGFLARDVQAYTSCTPDLIHAYHFGGYAKTTPALNAFIEHMMHTHQLPLDHVYTAKLLYGVFDLIEKEYFASGATVLVLHTGGLQSYMAG